MCAGAMPSITDDERLTRYAELDLGRVALTAADALERVEAAREPRLATSSLGLLMGLARVRRSGVPSLRSRARRNQ